MGLANLSSYNGTWVNGIQVLTYDNNNWDCLRVDQSVQAFNHCDSFIRGNTPIWNPTNIGDPSETVEEIATRILRLFRLSDLTLSSLFATKDTEGKTLWKDRWNGFCRDKFIELQCRSVYPVCGSTTKGWALNSALNVPCQTTCTKVTSCCNGFLEFSSLCNNTANAPCYSATETGTCPSETTAPNATRSVTPMRSDASTSKPWLKTALLVSLISSTLFAPIITMGSLS